MTGHRSIGRSPTSVRAPRLALAARAFGHFRSSATVVLFVLLAAGCGGPKRDAGAVAPGERYVPVPTRSAPSATSAGRAVPVGDPAAVAAVSAYLDAPTPVGECGPYRLITDARGRAREHLRAVCAGAVVHFEREYAARLGVEPAHPPAGTIVAFGDRGRFRAWLAVDGGPLRIYAGLSRPAEGLVVLPVDEVPADELARTLIHELAHLAHRRTFGVVPEPWLSEGLADVVSESATVEAFRPLAGFDGVEGLRQRLLGAQRQGRLGSLADLTERGRDRFDAAAVSDDYEQAALLVRFLLLDPELAPLFQATLAGRARPGRAPAPPFPPTGGPDWAAIEARFVSWLGSDPPSADR